MTATSAFVDFNISHHGAWVVFVAVRGCLVGVDVTTIEVPRRGSVEEFLDCFTTQFTAHELDTIHSPAGPVTILPAFSPATRPKVATPPSDPRLHMFFWHWACKEAYVKARGIGLGFDLQRADFTIRDAVTCIETRCPPISLHVDGVPAKQWRFGVSMLDAVHPVVVALGPVDQATAGFGEVVAKQLPRGGVVGDDAGCAHEAAAGASSGAADRSGAGGGVLDAMPDDATLATWFPLFEEVELDALLEVVEGVPKPPAAK